jgi:hypothetical protein
MADANDHDAKHTVLDIADDSKVPDAVLPEVAERTAQGSAKRARVFQSNDPLPQESKNSPLVLRIDSPNV